jgi:peptidoglycan DL-endopeptidase CwlO
MTMPLSGITDVTARIASIQSRIAQLSSVAPAATAASSSSSSSSGSTLTPGATTTSFADALAAFAPAGTAGTTGTIGTLGPTGTASTSGATGSSPVLTVDGDRVVADAKRYLGVPYKWGGTDPRTGLDCSGLVQQVYGDLGIDVPRVSADQARAGRPVSGGLANARPGDLVAFGSPVDHIGIYAGGGKMVVAPHTGDVVKVQTIHRTPTAIRRILPDTATAPSLGGPPSAAMAKAPAAYRGLFAAAGAKYGVPADLLAAVARAESGFDPTARSSAGAIGLMQIMPGTARGLGVDPRDPAQAVDGAARLLARGLKKYDGSVPLALAAYNAGPGAVAKYGGIPPYKETQAYVRRVLAYQNGAAA